MSFGKLVWVSLFEAGGFGHGRFERGSGCGREKGVLWMVSQRSYRNAESRDSQPLIICFPLSTSLPFPFPKKGLAIFPPFLFKLGAIRDLNSVFDPSLISFCIRFGPTVCIPFEG